MTTDDIPAGFVLVAAYDEREGGQHTQTGPKGDYQRLLKELRSDTTKIRAFKQGGQWVACKKDVEEFLVNLHRPPAEAMPKRGRAAKTAPGCVSIDSNQAEKLFGLLGRIAAALEELASRPDDGPDCECEGDEQHE